jgi:hypothetical protein
MLRQQFACYLDNILLLEKHSYKNIYQQNQVGAGQIEQLT